MEKRSEIKRQAAVSNRTFILVLLGAVFVSAAAILFFQSIMGMPKGSGRNAAKDAPKSSSVAGKKDDSKTVRIMANGDLLYHDGLYMSAQKADGSYDFSENFTYVKDWLQQGDLVLGDFEGTIRSDYPLGGYPLFNAPEAVVPAIKDAGYQVVDLAHNHILDSGLEGVFTTAKAFENHGISPVGVYTHKNRDKAPILIKEVKGIKIAILAYSYGFNGLESNLSQKEMDHHLSTFDEDKMKAEIKQAEKEADITVVMPQTGIEYQLEPNEEQVELYHKMVDWGADIIFGGHPHVVQPSEILEKDGQKKLIIYSMGNFISNQRIETMAGVDTAEWTERGVLMDVTIEKTDKGTIIKKAQAHPSWVSRVEKGTYSPEGYPLYTYQTLILEDFIEGGKYRNQLDQATKDRIDTAYKEMKEHVHLNWN
ncbi:CapA family protein [Streptococcus cristatus]|uniref:Capsule biosynthesis protein CapA n=1 Tax=Streptococcus cristatus TaxID=45634 RepID=A0A3R9HFX2_STRCR|nr:CapA family protein [Streptococcus cristatus]RSI45138.1 Capsule biosynthesis protein CapA [Streptococcus cristatus]